MIRSRERDQSMERLLRQSIDAPQDSGVTDACLDAEALAAMIDGGLSGPVLDAAQSHVADCARCQSLVGALARADSVMPPRATRNAARWWLAWAVPLAAAAAAVAIWVAVPTRPDAPLLQETERPLPRAAELPGRAPEQGAAPLAPQVVGRLEAPEAPAKEDTGARAKASLTAPGAKKNEQDLADELRRDAAAPSAVEGLKKQSASANAMASTPTEESAPAAAPQAAAPSPGARTASRPAGAVSSLTETISIAIDIISPDPKVRWRLLGSIVQGSTDGGATWVTQSSGNVSELTTGAAPSASVCWVVGRGGVVLLAIDGRTWRRVPFPETTDLSTVRATDARSASVSTTDGRTFSTTDAGATWVAR